MFIAWTILPLLRSSGFPESLSYLIVQVANTVLFLSEAAAAAAAGFGVV